MKLTVERADLLKALGHAQSVVERRNTIPILSNVKIEASDGRIRLTATDLDLAMATQAPAEVAAPGGTTAPAHTFYDIARKLPDGAQIEIGYDTEKSRLTIAAGRSQFTLSCLPKEDFPAMSEGELPIGFMLSAGDLRRLIDKTQFAISSEETRYYLNGIYLHAMLAEGTGTLRAVATDGHRLAKVEMALPDGAGDLEGVIVPRKTVGELRKLLEETDAEVRVDLSQTKVRFTFDDAVLTSKLIDGTFPDYNRVIPSGNDKEMQADPRTLAQAVDRVSTIATDKSRAVKLGLAAERLAISAVSPENGTAEEEIAVGFAGEGLEIGFNSKYLLDVAKQIEGETAHFTFADATSPTLIKDSSDDGALYVLMPMRV